MLVIGRNNFDALILRQSATGEAIAKITILPSARGRIRIGIDAGPEVTIFRAEIDPGDPPADPGDIPEPEPEPS